MTDSEAVETALALDSKLAEEAQHLSSDRRGSILIAAAIIQWLDFVESAVERIGKQLNDMGSRR